MERLFATPWNLVIGLVAVVMCLGGLLELTMGPGGPISQDFFLTCGTAGPLIALALFVDIAVVMAPVIQSQGLTHANEMTVRALVRINTAMFVTAEAAALYAVGTETSSLFLVVSCVLPWLVQLLLLAQTIYYKTGVSRVGPG